METSGFEHSVPKCPLELSSYLIYCGKNDVNKIADDDEKHMKYLRRLFAAGVNRSEPEF